ncbi:hypothetical protein ATO6_15320 [Oceanicola sp. 22II-s10i]|nr:hypothetical protein ATO6_15320 [Oceanicola sp. 22II-s10i]
MEAQAALNGALFFEDALADLPAGSEGDTAFVLDDGTSSNNGIYLKGASTWAKTANLPAAFSDAVSALADLAVLEASLSDVATSGSYDDLSGKPTLGSAAAADAGDFATAAQGEKADTAVQPGDIGTAAAAATDDFATAAQGDLADTAVQPGALAGYATAGRALDLSGGIRPGDAPDAYGASITGTADAMDAVTGSAGVSVVTDGDLGSAIKVTDVALHVARRQPVAIRPGRIYRTVHRVKRLVVPADPLSDAVEIGIRWLTATQTGVAGGSGNRVIATEDMADADEILAPSGATFSLDLDADYTIPATTAYARPWVRLYGTDHETLVGDCDLVDVTEIAALAGVASSGNTDDLTEGDNKFVSAAQRALIDTAVQPGDIGTAAAQNVEAFATAAQGGLADSAVQPAREVATSGLATGGGDLSGDRTITVAKASADEAIAGSADDKAVTPLGLDARISPTYGPGIGQGLGAVDDTGRQGWLTDPVTGELVARVSGSNGLGHAQGLGDRDSAGWAAELVDPATGERISRIADVNGLGLSQGEGRHDSVGRAASLTDRATGETRATLDGVNGLGFGQGRASADLDGRAALLIDPTTGAVLAALDGDAAVLGLSQGWGPRDASGRAALLVGPDGEVVDGTSQSDVTAYQLDHSPRGTSLAVVDDTSKGLVIVYDEGIATPNAVTSAEVRAGVSASSVDGVPKGRDISLASSITIEAARTTAGVYIWFGQSKSNGNSSIPALTTTAGHPGVALMLSGGARMWNVLSSGLQEGWKIELPEENFDGLVDLVEVAENNAGETSLSGFADRMVATLASDEALITNTFGVSGQPWADETDVDANYVGIRRGTWAWDMLRRGALAMARHCYFATPRVTPEFRGLIFAHGQTDAVIYDAENWGQAAAQADYLAKLLELQVEATRIKNDVFQQSGEAIIYLIIAADWGNAERAAPFRAMWQAHVEHPTKFRVVATDQAQGQIPRADGTHYTNVGGRRLGEIVGEAINRYEADETAIVGLIAAERSGDTITCTISLPEGDLVDDASEVDPYISDPGNLGFYYTQTGGTARTISSVSITSADNLDGTATVEITLSGDPGAPSAEEVGICFAQTSEPRSPLRDTSTATSDADSEPLFNFITPSYVTL